MIAAVPAFLRALPAGQYTPCHQHDALFTSDEPGDMEQAKALCGDCPIRQGCADYAIENGETAGVWGGLTPDERAASAAPPCGTAAAWRRHVQRDEGCTICREAHDERLREDRLTRLATEHALPEGGSMAGYRLELLLGLPTCGRCRAVRRDYYATRPRAAKWYRRPRPAEAAA